LRGHRHPAFGLIGPGGGLRELDGQAVNQGQAVRSSGRSSWKVVSPTSTGRVFGQLRWSERLIGSARCAADWPAGRVTAGLQPVSDLGIGQPSA
jgi:hypothetical protein